MITTNSNFEIEKTKDNYSILRINKDKKRIYIGSKYNMKSEIDKFLEKVGDDEDKNRIFVIYGFATGEHIKALRDKFKENKIFVFEPNKKLEKYIDTIDWVKKDEKLKIVCGEIDQLQNNILIYIDEFNMSLVKFIDFSNYNDIYEMEFKKFLKEVKEHVVALHINIRTKFSFSKRWFETLIKNIPYIVRGTPIDLYRNIYKNKPAVIVSAGPSLEKNIEQLKQLNNEMIIISGGRTLKALIDKKITPNFVTAADPEDLSYELVKGYIEDLSIPLIFYEGTNEKIVSNYKGEKIFFAFNSFINKIVEKNLMEFSEGGSVAHTMTKCAMFFGCNPIIFVGQDLAYTNDEKYSSISGNRNLLENDNDLKNTTNIWVEDINGEKVKTSLVLNHFRINFESIIKASPDINFINATEGGARIHGTIEMPLYEAIEKYKGEKLEPVKKIECSVDMKKNSLDALKEAKESTQFIINKSKKSLRYLDELKVSYVMKNNSSTNKILRKLDIIDKEIKDKFKDVELIGTLLYPIIYETLISKSIDDNNPSFNEMKLIIEKNKKLYEKFLDELKYSEKYIDDALLKVQEIK